ncbi:hypothetical protein D3C77_812630 [compost metagenome]
MYCLSSASHTYGPCARLMKRGVPPTERKARTGELTPPGMLRQARSNSCSLRDMAFKACEEG